MVDGSAKPRTADHDGAALRCSSSQRAQYPELSGDGGRVRLVVFAEVGGRWSVETAYFLASLAKAKTETAPDVLRGIVQQAYVWKWSALLACSAVRAFSESLLDRRPVPAPGATPFGGRGGARGQVPLRVFGLSFRVNSRQF